MTSALTNMSQLIGVSHRLRRDVLRTNLRKPELIEGFDIGRIFLDRCFQRLLGDGQAQNVLQDAIAFAVRFRVVLYSAKSHSRSK